ncbi:MAG: phosphate signaling complex protein PhoU [bacterium]|jgi:phosphate transport system protein|nr:phosphate signaling complex protein PhoU [bacterium]
MSTHLRREIEKLKRQLLTLSAIVEGSVQKAVRSISERDAKLARQVLDTDGTIDQMEVDVEEECLKILALHQPVATDLRFIIAVLKINNDLERIGDLSVNIAERAIYLSGQEKIEIPFDFPKMSALTQSMLHRSLDALVNADRALADAVCAADDELDKINREMYSRVKAGIRNQPERLDSLIHLLAVSRQLERIGDHATNIAEDVIYMIEGTIVRHGGPENNQIPNGQLV